MSDKEANRAHLGNDSEWFTGPDDRIQPAQGRRGFTGVMSTGWDGNYSVNYGNVKNVREVTHICYGEEDEDCPGCMGVGC